jgi:hypothetical protein
MSGKLELQKQKIQELGLNAIKEYFNVDVSDLNKEALAHIHQKAKIGMQFEKEMNVSKRAVEMNYLRVFKLYAEDKKELKSLLKKSMSHYLPK